MIPAARDRGARGRGLAQVRSRNAADHGRGAAGADRDEVMVTVKLQPQERELVELTLEDLHHIAKETAPDCDDHQLRRVSVQLRNLLIENCLVRSWKLLQLQPKSPIIIAPRLRTDGLGADDFAVSGSGNVAGMAIANFRIQQGRAVSPEEHKARYEQEKGDIEYPFSLSDYKESCAVYVRGQRVSRRQLMQYVANKKGGAHLDHARKKDPQAYSALDAAIESGLWFGASPAGQPSQSHGKNPVYLELLSIGQNLTNSPDIRRFMDGASHVLGRDVTDP
jgi:hypothetical protein